MKQLSDILPPNIKKQAAYLAEANRVWKKCAGDMVATVTMPLKVVKDVLYIAVNDNVWMNELSMMKREILTKLEQEGRVYKDIKFLYRPLDRYAKPGGDIKRQVTKKEKEIIERTANVFDDEEMKNKFKKAMHAYFELYSLEDFE